MLISYASTGQNQETPGLFVRDPLSDLSEWRSREAERQRRRRPQEEEAERGEAERPPRLIGGVKSQTKSIETGVDWLTITSHIDNLEHVKAYFDRVFGEGELGPGKYFYGAAYRHPGGASIMFTPDSEKHYFTCEIEGRGLSQMDTCDVVDFIRLPH